MTTREDANELRARVRSLTLETADVLSVELEGVDGPLPGWTPGAHIDLALPGAPVRQYSLCGEPASARYRIAVLREEQSRGGSRAVHERLRPGDVVSLRGPRTHFGLEPADEYLFLAGGIGITPVLPMVRAAAAAGVPWRVLYLGASRTRMAFLDDLAALPGGTVDVVARDEGCAPTSRPSSRPTRTPRCTRAVPRACSGRSRAWCPRHPVAFTWSTSPPRGGVRARRTVRRAPRAHGRRGDRRTRAERARGAARRGCRRALRLRGGHLRQLRDGRPRGEVEHRDFVLTAQERAANDCMMVCVSRSACPVLVLQA